MVQAVRPIYLAIKWLAVILLFSLIYRHLKYGEGSRTEYFLMTYLTIVFLVDFVRRKKTN